MGEPLGCGDVCWIAAGIVTILEGSVQWGGRGEGAVLDRRLRGLTLVPSIFSSVLATMVVPRATNTRLTTLVSRALRRVFDLITDRVESYMQRDRIMSLRAPAWLMALLLVWILALLVGYGLMMWPWAGSLADGLRLAGSSMLTLGFVVPDGGGPTALSSAAAASGLIVVALQIAYVPTMYSAPARRPDPADP